MIFLRLVLSANVEFHTNTFCNLNLIVNLTLSQMLNKCLKMMFEWMYLCVCGVFFSYSVSLSLKIPWAASSSIDNSWQFISKLIFVEMYDKLGGSTYYENTYPMTVLCSNWMKDEILLYEWAKERKMLKKKSLRELFPLFFSLYFVHIENTLCSVSKPLCCAVSSLQTLVLH